MHKGGALMVSNLSDAENHGREVLRQYSAVQYTYTVRTELLKKACDCLKSYNYTCATIRKYMQCSNYNPVNNTKAY